MFFSVHQFLAHLLIHMTTLLTEKLHPGGTAPKILNHAKVDFLFKLHKYVACGDAAGFAGSYMVKRCEMDV